MLFDRKKLHLMRQHLNTAGCQEFSAQQQPIAQTRITAKIDDYFSGFDSTSKAKERTDRRHWQTKTRLADSTPNCHSQPMLGKMQNNGSSAHDSSTAVQVRRVKSRQITVHRPNPKKLSCSESEMSEDDPEGEVYQFKINQSSGNQQTTMDASGNMATFQPGNELQSQLSKMRSQLILRKRQQSNRARLQNDFHGIGLKQLASTQKDLLDSRTEILSQQKKQKSQKKDLHKSKSHMQRDTESMDTIEDSDNTKEVLSQNLTSLRITSDHLQTSHAHQFALQSQDVLAFVSSDQLIETQKRQAFSRPLTRDARIGQRKISLPVSVLQHNELQPNSEITNKSVLTNRRLFSSNQCKSHLFLGSISTKAVPRDNVQRQSLSSANQQRLNAKARIKMIKSNSQMLNAPNFLQKVITNQQGNAKQNENFTTKSNLLTTSKPSHLEKALSQISIFKTKMQIDDELSRLGPENKVNDPQHHQLYFKTNPRDLLLKILKPKRYQSESRDEPSRSNFQTLSSSSCSSSNSLRSKIAQNEALMNKPTLSSQASNFWSKQSLGDNDKTEAYLRQMRMAPVKDWTSTISLRVQNNRHGVETTKKHYKREAVAKYIYNKFGVHLLTYNQQTRNEMIPLLGEHLRKTNNEAFKHDKNELSSRKNSTLRSNLMGLKRDLSNQNLAAPKQLQGVEIQKFVRKRVFQNIFEKRSYKDHESEPQQMATSSNLISLKDESMNSPDRASQSCNFAKSTLRRQTASQKQVEERPTYLLSHKSQAYFHESGFSEELREMDIYQFLPARPIVDSSMDNLEWQRATLKVQSLSELFAAKCADLQIEKDQFQFEKFCKHVISKAKNRRLDLSNCHFRERSACVLARQFMMRNFNVVSYDLSSNELGDLGTAEVAEALMQTSHIVYLNLDMNRISSDGIRSIAQALEVNNSLQHLSISSGKQSGNNRNRLMEIGAYELAEALSFNKFLIILDLTGNSIGSEGLSYLLPAIEQSKTLICLNLSQNEITSGPIRQKVLKNKQREADAYSCDWKSLKPFKLFDVESGKVTDAEKRRFRLQSAYLLKEFIEKNQSLLQLNLSANKIGNEGLEVISGALSRSWCILEQLNLSETSVTHEGFRALVMALKTNHKLQQLIMDKNNLNSSHSFTQIFHTIASGNTLKVLSLANCHLTDTFGCQFSEAMKTNKGLKKLNFYGNELTWKTLAILSTALKDSHCSLYELNLGKNGLNDKGGVKLAEMLKSNKSLVRLILSDNYLTDLTALALNKHLKQNKQLEEVNLSKNLVNIRVLEMLRATLDSIQELKEKAIVPQKELEKLEFKNDKKLQAKYDQEKSVNESAVNRIERDIQKYQKLKRFQEVQDQKLLNVQKRKLDELKQLVDALELRVKVLNSEKTEVIGTFDIHQRNILGKIEEVEAENKDINHKLKKVLRQLKDQQDSHEAQKTQLRQELAGEEYKLKMKANKFEQLQKELVRNTRLPTALSERASRSGQSEVTPNSSQASIPAVRRKGIQAKKAGAGKMENTSSRALKNNSETASEYATQKASPNRGATSSRLFANDGKATAQPGVQNNQYGISRQKTKQNQLRHDNATAEAAYTSSAAAQGTASMQMRKVRGSLSLSLEAKSFDAQLSANSQQLQVKKLQKVPNQSRKTRAIAAKKAKENSQKLQ